MEPSTLCTAVEMTNHEMGTIGNIQRFLVVGFDGETLLMAMTKMLVTVKKTGANHTCMSMTAAQDMSKVEFTYVHWDTSAITDAGDLPDWWSPEDKILVSGGSGTTPDTPVPTAVTTEGPGYLGVPLKFSLSSDTFPEGRFLK